MGKKAKGKHRLDKFYHLAKEQGCVKVHDTSDRVMANFVTQVAAKYMPVSSLIVGVDLDPIKPIRGVKTLIGDITTQKTRAALRKEANGGAMDCVLHDGAPNVGGAWTSEAFTQSALVLESLRLATEFLTPGGTFVTKIFRSKDYTSLLFAFNQLFTKVEATKPAASRATSAEIFVVCLGYKAPAKIDPRLLDPRHLFQEVTEIAPNAGPDALIKHKIKKQRHREGYADGISTTHRAISAAAFVMSDHPVEVLGNNTRLVLEGPGRLDPPPAAEGAAPPPPLPASLADHIASHPSTNDEIRALCADLQVLGRSEFKLLLKWRLKLRKGVDAEAKAAAKGAAAAAPPPTAGEEEGLDEEDKVLLEMAELKEKMDKQRKKERRRRHELKLKARMRAAQLAQAEGIADVGTEEGLFSLATIKGKGAAARLQQAAAPGAAELAALEASSSSDGDSLAGSDSDADSEERMRRYDAALDEGFEESYQAYLVRQKLRKQTADASTRKRKRLGAGGELDAEDEEQGMDAEEVIGRPLEEDEEEGGGLLVQLPGSVGRPTTAAAQAAQWFSQDLFSDPTLTAVAAPPRRRPRPTPTADADSSDATSAEDLSSSGEEGEGPPRGLMVPLKTRASKTAAKAVNAAVNATSAAAVSPAWDQGASDEEEAAGFEVVPAPAEAAGSSDSEDEFEALDDDAKVEIRALAKRMLRGKERWSLVEAAYNKHAFNDDALPRWFEEDQRKHSGPIIELTKQELDDAKEALKAVNARPIKKVAEAKARKRKRLADKLAAARQKAEAIAGQDDVPAASKMREIERVMAKARATGGKGKKKGGRNSKRKGPPLDSRLRADKRQVNAKVKAKVEKKKKRKAAKARARKAS